jgi:hypothetical protein
MTDIKDLNKEQLQILLQDAAKNWLAHDGLWFQAVENKFGLEAALEMDTRAWEKFTVIEAQRILKFLGLKPGGGIAALVQALNLRLYAHINVQEIQEVSETRCVFRMNNCRVQEARKRKELPDFPCKSVGLVEYSGFARTIDPRLKTRCLACPPDPHPSEFWCAWEFSLEK